MNQDRSNLKKWLIRLANLAIVAMLVWCIRHTLVNAWHQLGQYQWDPRPSWLVLAGVLYLLALLPAGFFWYRALRALGQEPRIGEALPAYYVGHLGKYVPGKVMVVVLRAALVRSHRVDTGVAAASVFLETFTFLAAGSFLAAGYLAAHYHSQPTFLLAAVGLMAVVGLPTCPPVFTRLAGWAGVGRSRPDVVEKLHRLRYRTLLTGWLLMFVVWAVMGLSYWATLRGMGTPVGGPIEELPRYTANVALATAIGFLALVIPAGMGVREAALIALMAPHLEQIVANPDVVAVVSVALFRVVSVVSEASISGILYVSCLRKTAP